MSKNPYKEERDNFDELMAAYQELRSGNSISYIDEEGFERIIEYF